MVKRNIALEALFLLALGVSACDDPAEEGRVIVDIKEINDGFPVQSDVLFDDGTNPAYVPEDIIPIVLSGRPYNDFITGNTHFQIIVEQYTITWTRVDGGTGTLATRTENAHMVIPVGDKFEGAIRLTRWEDKTGPVLSPLVNTLNSITMRADIAFEGREMGTEKKVKFAASLTVNFADVGNAS